MKNFEKYEKNIREVDFDFAVVKETGKLVSCSGMHCDLCKFYGDEPCATYRIEWLYRENFTDWSKIKMDTVIRVKQASSHVWTKRHFAFYKGGKVYAWLDGKSSATVGSEEEVSAWNFAELAEEEKI